MTWFEGGTMTEPAGHESSKKAGIVVLCDVCRLSDEFFSDAVKNKAGVVGIQRLLYRRGWTANLTTGEDACPNCTLAETAVS